jgi:hypothetical protein
VAQIEANKRKLQSVWVTEKTIDTIVGRHKRPVRSILCHGTRNGAEQSLFAKAYPEAEIIGTEISDTAGQFPRTIQWDMHEPRPEWLNRFDIVYSNCIDHAICPEKAIATWLGQTTKGGRLYIEHANHPLNNVSNEQDPLEISDEEMEALIVQCGGEVDCTLDGFGANDWPTRIYVIRCA